MWSRQRRSAFLWLFLLWNPVSAFRRLPVTNSTFSSSANAARRLVDVPEATSPQDHLVESLTFLETPLKSPHYAGLLPANAAKTKYFFYWMFTPPKTHKKNEEIPLILWLNGGPGCSSMDGLFLEHGPFRLELLNGQNWKLQTNPNSWHNIPAYVVYVDQPVGTGLSFTTNDDYPKNDDQVNADFYYWLQEFLKLHADSFLTPQKNALKRPVFFSGESHAGHYIPSMMNYIHQQAENPLGIKFDGAAIGNGWVDPYYQYAGAEAAYGHGLIGLAQKHALQLEEKKCQDQLNQGNFHASVCFDLLDSIIDQSSGKSGNLKISQYDVRRWELKHKARDFPPGHKRVESYLGGWPSPGNDPPMNVAGQVLKEIHATASTDAGQRYKECTDPPYNALSHQDGLGVVNHVIDLLEKSDSRLLFFNGVEDLICNHVGTEVFLSKMPWNHRDDFVNAPRYSWSAEGKEDKVSGYVKEFENLSYIKVLQSGHMVPMDVPEVAIDMMRTFLFNKSFLQSEQDLGRAKDDPAQTCPECPVCPATTESSSTSNAAQGDGGEGEDGNPVFQYVVAHSWIGAVLAVCLFLGVFLYVRRRQATPPAQPYQGVEMKPQYRDEPEVQYPEHDDDSQLSESEFENGNGII